jgi:hypothetical protein
MNAPLTIVKPCPVPNVNTARKDLLRGYIAEQIWAASIQADLILRFTEIGDDTGVIYAMHKHVAYTRSAAKTANDLRAIIVAEAGQ